MYQSVLKFFSTNNNPRYREEEWCYGKIIVNWNKYALMLSRLSRICILFLCCFLQNFGRAVFQMELWKVQVPPETFFLILEYIPGTWTKNIDKILKPWEVAEQEPPTWSALVPTWSLQVQRNFLQSPSSVKIIFVIWIINLHGIDKNR